MLTTEECNNLLSAMQELLDEYDYDYSNSALDDIISEWASQKAPLIEAFKEHPNYIEGKFMIAFDYNYERAINLDAVSHFSEWLRYYPMTDFRDQIPEAIIKQRELECCYLLPDGLYSFLGNLRRFINARTITEETANRINKMLPEIHAHAGQKSSRVINKICTYLGYNKHPDYNKEFAKFADALSPMTIKRHIILSLNPLDYLTMSFGNSWASCHTIDKTNRRGMPNSYEGQYSSGTMSYMLDPSSMVLYTVVSEYDGTEYYTQPKVHRQMFHWGEDKLVQGRLYPQDNDCNGGEEYTQYRNFVQEVMSTIFDFPNLWTVKRGIVAACQFIQTCGTHYADYANFSNCTLSIVKDSVNENDFQVGDDPICIKCGCRHDLTENINHCAEEYKICAHCGCVIECEDDEYWVNDEVYCRDCVSYCNRCGQYHIGEVTYIPSEKRYVCETCLDRHYIYCEECNTYYSSYDMYYVESNDRNVCQNCYDEYYVVCAECGDTFRYNDAHQDGDDWYCDVCFKTETDAEAC